MIKKTFTIIIVFILFSSIYPGFVSGQEQSENTSQAKPAAQINQIQLPIADLGYSKALRLSGSGSRKFIAVPVFKGLIPKSIDFDLATTPNIETGFLTLEQKNKSLARVEFPFKGPYQIDFDPEAIEFDDEFVFEIKAVMTKEDIEECEEIEIMWFEFSDVVINYQGDFEPPDQISRLFHPNVKRLNIYLDSFENQAIKAALYAVEAVQLNTIGKDVRVKIFDLNLDKPNPEADPETITIVFSSGDRMMAVNKNGAWAQLEIIGSSDDWLGYSRELRESEALKRMTTAQKPDYAVGIGEKAIPSTNTFGFLKGGSFSFKGVGDFAEELEFSQSDFGFIIGDATARVEGESSTFPEGGTARVDLVFNDYLVDSKELSFEGGKFVLEGVLLNAHFQRDSEILVQASYVPNTGVCKTDALPLSISINVDSEIAAQKATILPPGHFDRYPQAIVSGHQLIFEDINPRSVETAANLLAFQQRLTSYGINLEVKKITDEIDINNSTVLILSDLNKVLDLYPRFSQTELYKRLKATQPEYVLYSIKYQEHPVLVSVGSIKSSLDYLAQNDGWFSLNGNVIQRLDGNFSSADINGDVQSDWWFYFVRNRVTMFVVISFGVIIGVIVLGLLSLRKKKSEIVDLN